ncbi:MAG: hypothetical protein WBV94_05115 [Blastocatellia bacterium]
MVDLGPKFNCSRCDLPEKEIKGNIETDCPRCPVTEAFVYFKEEVEHEIKSRFGGFREYSFKDLFAMFCDAARLLRGNNNRINPKWDATIAGACLIIQSEHEQARYIRLWNQRQSK